eukprot:gene9590-10598_t
MIPWVSFAEDEEFRELIMDFDSATCATSSAQVFPLESSSLNDGDLTSFALLTSSSDCSLVEKKVNRPSKKAGKVSKRTKQTFLREEHLNGEVVLVSARPKGFPTFDRSNFLVHLPIFIAKCKNTGDLQKLENVLTSRAAKDCVVVSPRYPQGMPGIQRIVDVYNTLQAFFPDAITCVTSISCWGNEIRSTYAFKKTDSVRITKLAQLQFPDGSTKFINDRLKYLRRMDLSKKTPAEIERLNALVSSDQLLTVHGGGTMKIRFDDNKRIIRFETTIQFFDILPCPFDEDGVDDEDLPFVKGEKGL